MSIKQKSIYNYFTPSNNDNEYQYKRYFYLEWTNFYRPVKQAYWTLERPEKINFIEPITCNYIKKGYYYYICGYIKENEENEGTYQLKKETIYKNIPYLKSHLQKCIRQQKDNLAIPTANHFMKLDLNDFLRRIIIIMLEDTILHNSFSTLVWLLVANSTKKLKMKKYIYEWLLGVVYVLCTITEIDNFNKNNDIEKINNKLQKYDTLNDIECSILYCIHIRISYGGMQGDLAMLNEYSNIWYERFKNKTKEMNNMEIRPININVKNLELKDWLFEAIDFHCNNKLIEMIEKKYEDINKEEIRKMIWYNSSSINTRVLIQEKYCENKWNEIKDYVYKTQKYLLESNY